MITVNSWGIGGRLVDGGVVGQLWLGRSRGGAVDLSALALANRIVGNGEEAAGLETCGGLSLAFDSATMIAVTGAVAEVSVANGPHLAWGSATIVPAGCALRVVRLLEGARAYIAVRGGLTVTPTVADLLMVGPDPGTMAAIEAVPRPNPPGPVGLWPGPRRDWFGADAWPLLCSTAYTVAASSRVGTRLAGPALDRVRLDELASEGVVEGAVQVPPDGQPIVMLADHPTTGGYPVIAVVDQADLSTVAQAPPGTELRFRSLEGVGGRSSR